MVAKRLTCSASGHRLAASGASGVAILDTKTWRVIRELKTSSAAICFSPDGRFLATCEDGLLLWNVDDGTQRVLVTNAWGSPLCGFLPERGLTLFEVRTGSPVAHFDDYLGGGMEGAAAFSPDGRWFAYGTTNYTIQLWGLAGARRTVTLKGHRWKIDPIIFSPDSKLLASGGWDSEIWLWSVQTAAPLCPALRGHQSGLCHLLFSADSKTLVSDSDDQTIRWWSVATGKEMLLLDKWDMVWTYMTDVPAVEWDMRGRLLAWVEAGSVHITKLPTLEELDAAEKAKAVGVEANVSTR